MEYVNDGFIALTGGMDAYRSPALLPDTTAAKAINVSFRGALGHTRPGFVEQRMLPGGFFQGAGVWSNQDSDWIVYVATGVVFALDLDNDKLYSLGDRLSHTSQCYFSQADKYMVVQDGASEPVFLALSSGSPIIVPTTTGNTTPPGTVSLYAHGRLHLVPRFVPETTIPGDACIVSGDIFEPWDPESVLRSTETTFLAEGGAHGLPIEVGPVGALGSMRNSAAGTGIGQTVVFARHGVCAFDFSIPRDEWKQRQLSQVMFFGSGSESPWAVLNVNNDLIYRSIDGLRTLRYAASQSVGGDLSNLPISSEVDVWLGSDADLLSWVSIAYHSNRVFTTTVPENNENWFLGMVVWDTAAAATTGQQGVVYDGLWTCDRFQQTLSAIRNGKRELFVFSEGPRLAVLDETARDDQLRTDRLYADDVVGSDPDRGITIANVNGDLVTHRIQSALDTKVFSFTSPQTFFQFKYVDFWLSEILGEFDLSLYVRPQGYPKWIPVGSRSYDVAEASMPQRTQRFRLTVPEVSEYCDPATGVIPTGGYGLQFSVRMTGHAKIERAIFAALPVAEEPVDVCDVAEVTAIDPGTDAAGVELTDFFYVHNRDPYEPATYAVTYIGNSDEVTGTEGPQLKLEGTPLTLRPGDNFIRIGQTLASWNTAADGTGTEYALGASYVLEAPITLYAIWEETAEYVISYDINGADEGSILSQYKSKDQDIRLRTRSTLVRAGYYFDGWNTQPNGLGTAYTEGQLYETNASLLLYAVWVENPWNVTPNDYSLVFIDEAFPGYVGRGGVTGAAWIQDRNHWMLHMDDFTINDALVVDLGASSELASSTWLYPHVSIPGIPDTAISLPEGISIQSATREPLATAESLHTTVRGFIESVWPSGFWTTPHKLHIHIDESGSMTRTALRGALDLLEADLTTAGITYRITYHTNERWLRWLVPPVAPAASTQAISYNGNDADTGTVAPATHYKLVGEVSVIRGQEALVKTGNTFVSWNTASDGTGTDYFPGDPYSGSQSLALYANWEINDYSVAFDTGGGTAIPPVTQPFGTPITPPDDPILADYDFIEWIPPVPATTPAESVTCVAQWLPATTTLTFDVDGGSPLIDPITQLRGTAVIPPANPTKDDYGFFAWSPSIPATMPDEDLLITAQWLLLVTSTFNSDGGSAVTPITQMRTTSLTPPADPTRTGYTFNGWSPALPEAVPDTDATYTALWTVNQYTITFDLGDGVTDTLTQDFGSAITPPADPTRTYFTFWKWSPEIPATMPAFDQTIYAIYNWDEANQWNPSRYDHLLELWADASDPAVLGLFEGNVVSLLDKSSRGADFIQPGTNANRPTVWIEGNMQAITGERPNIGSNGHLICSTHDFKVANSSVVFIVNGGSAVSGHPVLQAGSGDGRMLATGNPGTSTLLDWYYVPTQGTRQYHISTGNGTARTSSYIAARDFSLADTSSMLINSTPIGYISPPMTLPDRSSGTSYLLRGQFYNLTYLSGGRTRLQELVILNTVYTEALREKLEGYFAWKWALTSQLPSTHTYKLAPPPMEYVLTFDTGGGTEIDPIVQEPGTAVVAPTDPTKAGHTFTGWDVAIPATMPSADTTYTAQWTPAEYTVYFDGNSQTNGTAPADQTKLHGVTLTLSGNTGSLTKTGNTITGWNTATDGTGTHYDLGGAYTANDHVTLYAEWTLLTYAVSYDGNTNDSGTAPDAQTKTHGSNLTLAGNTGTLAKTDFTLTGWNTATDGSGTHYDLAGTYATDSAIVLYAEWTAV